MSHFLVAVLGQDPDNYALPLEGLDPQARERWIILGAIGVVVLVIFWWATFIRRRPRHRRGHIKRDRHSLRRELVDGWSELKRIFAQRARERKRVRRRPRNPTRAEVGGLPAVRNESEGSSPDASSARSNF